MSLLNYKGFTAKVEFDPDDAILVGKLIGINDVVGFHADSGAALIEAFHEAVDDYVETCARIGKKRSKAYSGKLMLRVDPGVHAEAARAAEVEGKSLNAWSESALREAARPLLAARLKPVSGEAKGKAAGKN
jgi:predicted HicB family RNase H-like nuclease